MAFNPDIPSYAFWINNGHNRFCSGIGDKTPNENKFFDPDNGVYICTLPTPSNKLWDTCKLVWPEGYICLFNVNEYKKYNNSNKPPRL